MAFVKKALALLLTLALLATGALALDTGSDGVSLIFQMDNPSVLVNGGLDSIKGSNGESVIPYYSVGGTPMIPLFYLGERFGFRLSWNALSKQTDIIAGSVHLSVAAGSSVAYVAGGPVSLSCPVEVSSGSTYVPVDLLDHIRGIHYHVYSKADGAFLLISSAPLGGRDTIDSYKDFALRLLGPSKYELSGQSLVFRSGSRAALVNGLETDIVSDGNSASPYSTGDRYLMIPLEFAASHSGFGSWYGYKKYSDSCDLSFNGRKYSVYYGEHYILSGEPLYSNAFYCELRSGVVYVSATAFSYISGSYATFTKSPAGVVYSKYSGYPSLAQYCRSMVSSLPDIRQGATAFVALTFDDGPSGSLTERLLDGLYERGAHATFFLCDYRIEAYPSPMSRYAAEGHEIANHSSNHSTLTSLGDDALASEIDGTNSSIGKLSGVETTLLRPPGGAYNAAVLKALEKRGMSCVIWNVDPLDWKCLDKDKVVSRIVSSASDGDIILLHDLYSTSVDAALEAIDILSQRGFAFVTVSELAKLKGYTLEPGEVYSSFK